MRRRYKAQTGSASRKRHQIKVQMNKSLTTNEARLTLTAEPCAGGPLLVHHETLLGDLSTRAGQSYVLLTDDDDRVIGIVPTLEIDRRLRALNRTERSRWTAMPIGAMSSVSLADTAILNCPLPESEITCSAIREQGRLFGLAVDGDMFLSWRRLESLFTEALSDPLTGLMNRLAYERRLREEWNRAERTGTSIGVVIVDLDNFKGINDTYGHAVGDELLSLAGQRMEAAMRSYDVVARFGGDEFVALCLGCSPDDIRIPMNRLMEGLAGIELQADGQEIRVQASIGAAVRHNDFEIHQPEELFVAADECLYEAKKTRNNAWKIEFGCGLNEGRQEVGTEAPADDEERNIAVC